MKNNINQNNINQMTFNVFDTYNSIGYIVESACLTGLDLKNNERLIVYLDGNKIKCDKVNIHLFDSICENLKGFLFSVNNKMYPKDEKEDDDYNDFKNSLTWIIIDTLKEFGVKVDETV